MYLSAYLCLCARVSVCLEVDESEGLFQIMCVHAHTVILVVDLSESRRRRSILFRLDSRALAHHSAQNLGCLIRFSGTGLESSTLQYSKSGLSNLLYRYKGLKEVLMRPVDAYWSWKRFWKRLTNISTTQVRSRLDWLVLHMRNTRAHTRTHVRHQACMHLYTHIHVRA